jgi:hypothetical protein
MSFAPAFVCNHVPGIEIAMNDPAAVGGQSVGELDGDLQRLVAG